MTTAEVLRAAKALISVESAWTQGVLCDASGRHCALGAVGAVLYPDIKGTDEAAEQMLYDRLLKDRPEAVLVLSEATDRADDDPNPLRPIYRFNDKAHHAAMARSNRSSTALTETR